MAEDVTCAGTMSEPSAHPNFTHLWLRIGALSFGGPAGQIALMHRELVERRGWIDDAAFLRALNFCMLLPGPEAQQLAVWCGWRLRGVRGGIVAGTLFVAPGAALMAALTFGYLAYGRLPLVAAGFRGIQAVVVAVVVLALWRLARRTLKTAREAALAAAAFAALWFAAAPFPLVMLVAGGIGWRSADRAAAPVAVVAAPSGWQSLRIAAVWAAIWAAPLGLCAALLGPRHGLTELTAFFMRVAAFGFGGAYAALAYVAQAAVDERHWLSPAAMLGGLGLAETTPGPLVLVFQFVGGIAGRGIGGVPGALAGMALVLWAVFVPSFLWIFAAAPQLDRIAHRPGPARALAGIAAATVGVMANLALWFALHVFFARVFETDLGLLRLRQPAGPVDAVAVGFALAAFVLLTRTRLGVLGVMVLGAAGGVAVRLASGG